MPVPELMRPKMTLRKIEHPAMTVRESTWTSGRQPRTSSTKRESTLAQINEPSRRTAVAPAYRLAETLVASGTAPGRCRKREDLLLADALVAAVGARPLRPYSARCQVRS